MKIWLSKNSEISIHEQLVAQITLGIASFDFKTGEKLPSTRELARRFRVHANTVNAAYKELAEEGLVEFRKGSGVFVRENSRRKNNPQGLDQIIARFLHEARKNGFDLSAIQSRLQYFLELRLPDHFLIVEPDADLREILMEEIRRITNQNVLGTSTADFLRRQEIGNAQIIALNDERENILARQPFKKTPVFLKLNSVSASMKGQPRPSESELIAVVSHWERFLLLAKTFLLAAQIDAETLILRSTRNKDWRKGLENAAMIICDSLTADAVSKLQNLKSKDVRPFRLISDESIAELKNLYAENSHIVR